MSALSISSSPIENASRIVPVADIEAAYPELGQVLSDNDRRRKAFAFARVAAGERELAHLQAVYPDFDVDAALADPEFGRLVELYSADGRLLERAANVAVLRGITQAAASMTAALADPTTSAAAAREIANTLGALSDRLERRRESPKPKDSRSLSVSGGRCHIQTPEHDVWVEGGDGVDAFIDVVKAMRCTTVQEARDVARVVRSGHGSITLPGF